MAKWLDPITYNFCFIALTDKPEEPSIPKAFRELLIPCKKGIMTAFGVDGSFYIPFCISSYTSLYNDTHSPYHWFDKGSKDEKNEEPIPQEEFDMLWNKALLALDSVSVRSMHIDYGAFSEKKARRNFSQRITPFGKMLKQLYSPHNPEYDNVRVFFEKNKERICDILNCPSETLDDVVLPLDTLRGWHLLDIYFLSSNHPLTLDEQPGNKERICQLLNLDSEKKYYEHRICFRFPRFAMGMGPEVSEMQNIWTDVLQRLSAEFELSYGSVSMDFSAPQVHPNSSCYDYPFYLTKPIYMTRYIPGYAWGMVLNKHHIALMKDFDALKNKHHFYRLTELKNGNYYFQLTDDVRRIKKEEAIYLRQVFEPHLPFERLFVGYGHCVPPPSFRLGCTSEHLDVYDKYLHSVEFCYVHPLQEHCLPGSSNHTIFNDL